MIFVIMPNCPDLGWSFEASEHFVKHVKETLNGSTVIDTFTHFPSNGFYDPLHPNREGAKIITHDIAMFFNCDNQ